MNGFSGSMDTLRVLFWRVGVLMSRGEAKNI